MASKFEKPGVPNRDYDVLIVSYDYTKPDAPVMLVGSKHMCQTTVHKMFVGEEATKLYKKLTGE